MLMYYLIWKLISIFTDIGAKTAYVTVSLTAFHKMGCKPSKLQIQHNGDLFNEDTDVRKKFITGLQLGRDRNGSIKGGFQMTFSTSRLKKYEKVANIPPINVEQNLEHQRNNTDTEH